MTGEDRESQQKESTIDKTAAWTLQYIDYVSIVPQPVCCVPSLSVLIDINAFWHCAVDRHAQTMSASRGAGVCTAYVSRARQAFD